MESVAEYVAEGYEYLGAEHKAGQVEVRLHWPRIPQSCPACSGTSLHSHGWRRRRVSHAPLGESKAEIILSFRRGRCQACGKVSSPHLPLLAPRQRLTEGLRRFLRLGVVQLQVAIKRLTDWLGLGWHSILRSLGSAPDPLAGARPEELMHLCLDEVFFSRPSRFMTVLSCASGRVLGLATGRGGRPSRELLNALPQAVLDQVLTLATDFNLGQRQAALSCLPYAEICADHFHLVRLCKQAVRTASAKLRPQVRQAAWDLRDILKGTDPDRLSDWLRRWASSRSSSLRTLHETVEKWQPELESAITTGRSTGPAEALNRKIAMIRRLACGYTNQNNFVQRILWLNSSPHH